MTCAADCLSTNLCNPVRGVQMGAVYSPYVRVHFNGKNADGNVVDLTVGNESSPTQGNHACIKSLQYGATSGQGVTIEIYDEQGSEFSTFMEHMNTCMENLKKDYNMFIDFGWIIRKCDGSILRNWASDNGRTIKFMPMKVDANYEQGKIKFTVTGLDLLDRVFEDREEKTQGTERNKKSLKDAIKHMFDRNNIDVKFLRQTDHGPVPFDFKNSDGGADGPRGTWPPDQQHALAAATKWLSSVTSDREKGIHPAWDCGSVNPTLILWEDGLPAANERRPGCERSMGTYIVGGGDCSPVISFNPKAEWNFTANATRGGGAGGGTSSKQVKLKDGAKEDGGEGASRGCAPGVSKKGGIQTQSPAPQNDTNWRPPEQVVPRLQQAISAHMSSAGRYQTMNAIECDLRIQGDPLFCQPSLWMDKTISIIVINPFHIFGGRGDCGDWLAQPPCNSIYSSKDYRIVGVSHEIREGTFTTTLKVANSFPLGKDGLIGGTRGSGGSGAPGVPLLKRVTDVFNFKTK